MLRSCNGAADDGYLPRSYFCRLSEVDSHATRHCMHSLENEGVKTYLTRAGQMSAASANGGKSCSRMAPKESGTPEGDSAGRLGKMKAFGEDVKAPA